MRDERLDVGVSRGHEIRVEERLVPLGVLDADDPVNQKTPAPVAAVAKIACVHIEDSQRAPVALSSCRHRRSQDCVVGRASLDPPSLTPRRDQVRVVEIPSAALDLPIQQRDSSGSIALPFTLANTRRMARPGHSARRTPSCRGYVRTLTPRFP